MSARRTSHRGLIGIGLVVAAAAAVWSCASPSERSRASSPSGAVAPPRIAPPETTEAMPRDFAGIHNAVAYHDGFISGSVPEGDEGFDTLAAMGVRTIISVDGAEPEVARAAARGMRYIHLPIGYNGFDERRRLELTRATRDAMANGRVYIHCHHGKHRSAGAAAAIAAGLGWLTPAQGVARMKVSGTAPNYTGLYACARNATALEASTLDAVPEDFPSTSRPSGFVQGMVEIDEAFEHLRQIERSGWVTPTDHPDLVPAAEAGRLADLFRSLRETPGAKARPAAFAARMEASRAEAQSLEDLLVAGERSAGRLSAALTVVAASCKDCHARFRD